MSRKFERIDEWLARWMADYVPRYIEGQTELERESVRLTVWLVGLAVGIIALLVTRDFGEPPWISSVAVSFAITFATATVFFGVLHRAAIHFGKIIGQKHWLDFRMDLAMRTADVDFGPGELSDHWDVEDIVARLREGYDLNYGFLLEYQVPLQKARDIYSQIHEQEKEWEQEALERFVEVVSAYADISEEQQTRIIRREFEQNLESRRETAREIQAWRKASTRTFYLTGLSFVVTIVSIAIGILGRI